MEDLAEVQSELIEQVAAAGDLTALERIRVAALGKKGRITGLMKTLGGLEPEARKAAGQALNAAKEAVAEAIEERKLGLQDADLDHRLEAERIDVSLPARPAEVGHIHPISQTVEEIVAIFGEMGFSVAEGP
ncbi:MAG: phenylalanine--tRNA ligase subunit alpha, partial [Rhodospirillales bacterium]|nr:phenylalanine--tRNA ligase subunit alpha [Rhodospirillales bacterium]